jgi:YoeB-like toxin of bacterial type II toxin-antitoxin system
MEITSKNSNAFLNSVVEYAAWQETAYPFWSPENARRLLQAAAEADSGRSSCWIANEIGLHAYWLGRQLFFGKNDRVLLKPINRLLDETLREHTAGIGNPERLK